MATVSMNNRKAFQLVRKTVSEVKNSFDDYHRRVVSTLRLSTDIIDYVRGWFDEEGKLDSVQSCLDHMERDFRIYYSRLFFLDDRFTQCERKIEQTARSMRGMKDDVKRLEKISECIDLLSNWQSQRKDFNTCFRAAIKEWEKVEHQLCKFMAENPHKE